MHFAPVLPAVFTVLALVYMGFLVMRNGSERINRLFVCFVFIDAFWLLAAALITNAILASVVWGRLVYGLAIILIMAVQAFTGSLLHLKYLRSYQVLLYGGGLAVFLLTLLTDFMIQDITIKDSIPYPVYGSGYTVLVMYVVATLSFYLFTLVRRWTAVKRTRDIAMKRQLNIVAFGLIFFVLVTLTTNLILPAIFQSGAPSYFAPVGSLILAGSLFYAISRYRLFDIRVAVVRGTTYIFLTATLALTFVLFVNVTSSRVNAFQDHPNLQLAFNTAVVLAIAMSFQPLKRIFDKITNRYFFRDVYNTQNVIDSLNSILISNTDVAKVLSLSESLFVNTLKLEFCFFGVFGSKANETSRVFGVQKIPLAKQEYIVLRREVFLQSEKVVNQTSIPVSRHALRELFKSKEISAVGKMISHGDPIGFIVFGSKKNGSLLTRQDLDVLAIAADQLAIATQNVLRFEEIQSFNVTLQQKVNEATKKLRESNERLRLLDRTKDDFISMASHQLRTPLTSVKGYVSMVLDGDGGKISETQRKLLTQSFVSAQRMVYLISDLLNVSRLKTGRFIIEPVESNLDKVIEEELEQLTETVKSRSLELTYNKPAHFPTLMLDETKIRQVIMNFVDNAIYYTQAGGQIAVNLVETPDSVEFTVVDNGIGVPRNEQHHLFDKFYRAKNAQNARPDGTGLGLFMAKKVIIAQGGAIIFKSTEGKGSTFGFTFPKAALAPKAAPKAELASR